MSGRNETRRNLFKKHFQRMADTQPHITRPITGRDRKGRAVRSGTRVEIPLRSERRKLARAFAAGEWKHIKAVA